MRDAIAAAVDDLAARREQKQRGEEEGCLECALSEAAADADIDLELAAQVISTHPDYLKGLAGRAVERYYKKEYAEAIRYLNQVVSSDHCPQDILITALMLASTIAEEHPDVKDNLYEIMVGSYAQHADDSRIVELLLGLAIDFFKEPVTVNMFYKKGLELDRVFFSRYESDVRMLNSQLKTDIPGPNQ